MRKPSLPRAAPWHAPVLQPEFRKTGMTSSLKLMGRSSFASLTVTGISAAKVLYLILSLVAPSAIGLTVPDSILARLGSARANSDSLVTSEVMPCLSVKRTTRDWMSREDSRVTMLGKTSSGAGATAVGAGAAMVSLIFKVSRRVKIANAHSTGSKLPVARGEKSFIGVILICRPPWFWPRRKDSWLPWAQRRDRCGGCRPGRRFG